MQKRKWIILSALFLIMTLCLTPPDQAGAKELYDCYVEGDNAYIVGRYQEALNAWEAGLRLAEEQDHKGWQGAFLGSIGLVYDNLGQYEKALSYQEKNLAIRRKIGEVKNEVAPLVNIGVVYTKLAQYEKALDYFEKALTIDRKTGNLKGEGDDLTNIGVVYDDLGQYKKALAHFQEALAIFRKLGDLKGEGAVFTNMGVVYGKTGKYKKALAHFEQALAIKRKIREVRGGGGLLGNIANVCRHLGLYEKALEYHQKALVIHRKIGDVRAEGLDLTNIGQVHENLGQYEKALGYYDKALALRRKTGDIKGEGWALNYMGYAMLGAGKLRPAESHLSSAVEIYESIRAQVKSGKERTGFQSTLPDVYGTLAATRLALGKAEGAFEAVERGRAKSFLDLLGTRGTGNGRAGRKTTQIAEMENRLASLRERRVKLASAPAGAKTRSAQASVDQEISELDRERLKLIDRLRRADPEIGSLAVVDPPALGEIQSLLTPGTSIVEYFHFGKHTVSGKKRNQLWVFVVRKDGFHFKAVDVSEEELKAALNRYAILLADTSSEKAALDRARAKLYAWLIQPVEDHISAKTLIIVPWGPMFKIPFTSLAPKGDEPLGARKNVVIAPSAGVCRYLVKKRASGRGRVYAIGNPKTAMIPLQGAEKEVGDIAGLFKKSTVRIRAKATESLIKRNYKNLGRPDVVHFACHGIFNEKAPELSHLALTPDQKNDGKLEMHEIFDLDWKGVSLVTMSACSSGKGKLGAGDDLIGLTRGFIFAGAPSILCSLWDVDDEATKALMVSFYKNYLGGMSKPESLRNAQITMMKNPKWSHPYYWSAFVLFGDWM